jgi:hypothetical protein
MRLLGAVCSLEAGTRVALQTCAYLPFEACRPNATKHFENGDLQLRAVRHIQNGEEICITYAGLDEPSFDRRWLLLHSHLFDNRPDVRSYVIICVRFRRPDCPGEPAPVAAPASLPHRTSTRKQELPLHYICCVASCAVRCSCPLLLGLVQVMERSDSTPHAAASNPQAPRGHVMPTQLFHQSVHSGS